MTKNDKAILLAMCIGDGYVHKDKKSLSASLQLLHSIKQKEYLIWKVNLCRKILGKKGSNIKLFNNNGYSGVRYEIYHKYFRCLRKWLYVDGKKKITRNLLNRLTPIGIAIWYMDDGNLVLHKRNGKIHSRELRINTYISKEDNQIIIDYFKEKFDIMFYPIKDKGRYKLSCGTAMAKNFVKIISKYIHPSLNYKIDFRY